MQKMYLLFFIAELEALKAAIRKVSNAVVSERVKFLG